MRRINEDVAEIAHYPSHHVAGLAAMESPDAVAMRRGINVEDLLA